MIEFRRVFKIVYPNGHTELKRTKYILRNPDAVVSMEEYLAPGLVAEGEVDVPKTQIDFGNGMQVVVLSDINLVEERFKTWDRNHAMGIDGEESI